MESTRLMVTHTHYDHSDADSDINVLFPIDRLRELADEGVVGSATETHIGMGFTQSFRELREKTVPEIADKIKGNKADIVLLTAG